jgi:voltage-gated potassium channel
MLAVDWCLWLVFLVEFVGMGLLADDRPTYVRRNWLGLAVVVISFPALPLLLSLVRLAYLLRLLNMLRLIVVVARCLHALRVALGRPGLAYLAALTAILMFAASLVLLLVEPQTVQGDFWNAAWWTMVTATTVGYGDIVPATPYGRGLGIGLMVAGSGLVATLSAAISAYFVRQDLERDDLREAEEMDELRARLTRIEAALAGSGEGTAVAHLRAQMDRIEAKLDQPVAGRTDEFR